MSPTEIQDKQNWLVFICKACGLLYKEEEGDPDSGIPPGTRFEDIPDDWACPLCGVTKDDFVLFVERDPKISSQENASSAQGLFLNSRSRHSDVLIIGAGKAGWEVAKALRSVNEELSITIVTGCNGDLYEKPLLSNAVLKKIELDKLVRENGALAAQRFNINLLTQTHAIQISPSRSQVRTTKGMLSYTHLVIAQGAKPVRHPVMSAQDCWHINHLSIYQEFRKVIKDQISKIAIIGAGLIGCELANDLAIAGHAVHLIDASSRPLAHLIPQEASQTLVQSWKDLPITFYSSAVIGELKNHHSGKVLMMQDGREINIDHVVLCMGLQSDPSLAKSADLEWNNGIAVHPQTLQTSQKNIYALGDCISIDGKVSRYIEPIIRQARVIAEQIIGNQSTLFHPTSPTIIIKTSALPMRLKGSATQSGEWRITQSLDIHARQKLQMTQWNQNQASATLELG